MCFSAPASFIAAAGIGATGALLVRRAENPQDLALAAFPLTFAAQQAVEGVLWLRLGAHQGACEGMLANGFLAFALVVWPVLAPGAALLAERSLIRRRIMFASLAAGVVVIAHMAWMMTAHPYEALVRGGSIAYLNDVDYGPWIEGLYGIAVCVPLLASSRRKVVIFGVLVIAGAAATQVAFHYARVSVWCFFAAIASIVLAAPRFGPQRRAASP